MGAQARCTMAGSLRYDHDGTNIKSTCLSVERVFSAAARKTCSLSMVICTKVVGPTQWVPPFSLSPKRCRVAQNDFSW